MESIAIIGAGLSGLAAARTLEVSGYDTVLYEKSHSPGGRSSTHHEHWGDFDQGAQYFTARDPRFKSKVRVWRHLGVAAPWSFEPMVWKHDELRSSPDREQRWVGTPDMHALARDMAQNLEIHTHTRIVQLQRDVRGWWLLDQHGHQHGPHDGIILTLPPRQATALLPLHSTLYSRLSQMEMEPCWSISLAYATKIADPWVQGIFCQHPMLRWVACNSAKPLRQCQLDIWVLHCRTDWTQQNFSLHRSRLQQYAREALAAILGHALPAPLHSHCQRWRYAMPRHLSPLPVLLDTHLQLAVCGDWQQGGRLEGAYLSGVDTADAMIKADTRQDSLV